MNELIMLLTNIFSNIPQLKDPIAFSVGSLTVTWYAIMIVTGMLIALLILTQSFKRRGLDVDFAFSIFLYAIPFGIIFARLGYVIARPEYYPINSWGKFVHYIAIWEGGLTITTGVVGGILGILLCCIKYKKSFFRVTDLMVVPLLVAQAIGRLGNYFNEELYGRPVTNAFFQREPLGTYIHSTGQWHYSLYFYEGFFNICMALFVLLLIYVYLPKYTVDKKDKFSYSYLEKNIDTIYKQRMPVGVPSLIYLTWYPFLRGMLEYLKEPSMAMRVNGYGVIQVIMLVVAPLMLLFLVLVLFKNIKLETKTMKIKHFGLLSQVDTMNNNLEL